MARLLYGRPWRASSRCPSGLDCLARWNLTLASCTNGVDQHQDIPLSSLLEQDVQTVKYFLLDLVDSIENEEEFGAFVVVIGNLVRQLGECVVAANDVRAARLLNFVLQLKELLYVQPLELRTLPSFVALGQIFSGSLLKDIARLHPQLPEEPNFPGASGIASRRLGLATGRLRDDCPLMARVVGAVEEALRSKLPNALHTRLACEGVIFFDYDEQNRCNDGKAALPIHNDSRGKSLINVVVPVSRQRTTSRTMVWDGTAFVPFPEVQPGEAVAFPAGILPHFRALGERERSVIMIVGFLDTYYREWEPLRRRPKATRDRLERLVSADTDPLGASGAEPRLH